MQVTCPKGHTVETADPPADQSEPVVVLCNYTVIDSDGVPHVCHEKFEVEL